MMTIRTYLFIGLVLLSFRLPAQQTAYDISVAAYVQQYKAIAMEKMKEFHIPASITLAQAILESGCGKSDLAGIAHNHFGIKCHKDWTGETYIKDDDQKNECFRKYSKDEDSFKDHSLFLTTHERYAFLFQLDLTDYASWAKGLKKAGYATNPKYPETLINLIEKYNLSQYDHSSALLAQKPKGTPSQENKKHAVPKTSTDDFDSFSLSLHNRKLFKNNAISYIVAQPQDSYEKIATDADISIQDVLHYNDRSKNQALQPGEKIYIESKKRNAHIEIYQVKAGDTPYSISQAYAIKMKRLCRYNHLKENAQLKVGQKLILRKVNLWNLFGLL